MEDNKDIEKSEDIDILKNEEGSKELDDIEFLDGDYGVEQKPKKKKFKLLSFKTKKDIITSIIILAAIVVIVIAAANIIRIMLGYKESADSYKKLEQTVAVEDDVKKTLVLNFDELLKACPDAVGWIYSQGVLSYPIVQCGDNETYLHRLYDGVTYNDGGTLFVDYRIPEGLEARNAIVYGHSMQDGSMFGNLMGYLNEDFFKQHPTFEVYVGPEKYLYKVFSAYVTDELSATYQMGYDSDESFQSYLDMVKSWSMYDCGVDVTAADKIMTLSTCYGMADTEQRLIVHLVRSEKLAGEIEGYETENADL